MSGSTTSGSTTKPAGAAAGDDLRVWQELAVRTRLASCGAEMRARHTATDLAAYITGPAADPFTGIRIVERGVLPTRRR